MLNRKHIAALCLASIAGLSTLSIAAASGSPQTRQITTHLKVLGQAKPSCHANVCTIRNHGSGTMTGYGNVTFTTVIVDDASTSPCKGGSWVPRLHRTILTQKGKLVLNEAGLVCPQPNIGPRVDLVWVADGARSTGAFAGVVGTGTDHAYLARNTATQTGTITVAH